MFSSKITWTVVCGPNSVAITEGAYPGGSTNVQKVPINDGATHGGGNTEFKLPTYTLGPSASSPPG